MAFPSEWLVTDPSAWLYSAAQVRELDRRAIEDCGVPGIQLMKRAGQVLFDLMCEKSPAFDQIIVFCGPGNNGGDGYIVAGLAARRNMGVQIIETSEGSLKGDALKAREFALQLGLKPLAATEWLTQPELPENSLLVDALLGTGFKGELREPFKSLAAHLNQSGLPIFAADIPSGLEVDTGFAAEGAVRADYTQTFIGNKLGLFTAQGRDHCGEISYHDLEVPIQIYYPNEATASLLDIEALIACLPLRAADAHKGNHGHLLVIGGDLGYAGAPLMAAESAARMGAGLVTLATRPEHLLAVIARCPEIMAFDALSPRFDELLEKVDQILIGPGLGKGAWGQRLLQKVLSSGKPTLFDADALNLLAAHQFGDSINLGNAVITPHPGEAARLLGMTAQAVNRDRLASLNALKEKFNCVVLLKGSGTLIANKSDEMPVTLCPYGNPGMGSGGMGDVLSGIIAGLATQGMDQDYAVNLGACVHAFAADSLAAMEGQRGILATDVIDESRSLLNGLV